MDLAALQAMMLELVRKRKQAAQRKQVRVVVVGQYTSCPDCGLCDSILLYYLRSTPPHPSTPPGWHDC